MKRKTAITSLLLFAMILFASCSQNDAPTNVSSNRAVETAKKPPSGPMYTAQHSQYNNSTSYISGSITGMTEASCVLSGGTGWVTFYGNIGDAIRLRCGYGGSGPIQIYATSGFVNDACIMTTEKIWFTNGSYKYFIFIGNASHQGPVSSGLPNAIITMNNLPFWILRAPVKNNNWSTVHGYGDPPNGVSYMITTTSP